MSLGYVFGIMTRLNCIHIKIHILCNNTIGDCRTDTLNTKYNGKSELYTAIAIKCSFIVVL